MKFNKVLLKLIASFLCLSIIFSALSPITANAQEIEYLKVQKKIQEQYQEGVPPEDILEALSEKEIKALVSFYSQQGAVSSISGFINLENDPEVLFIDSLASYYYDYYQEYGCFPDESNISTTNRNDIAFDDYSKIIKTLDYDYKNSEIAQQLVKIGMWIGLNAPVLMLHLLAILAGMAILAVAVGILYCAVATGVNDWLETLYIRHRQKMDIAQSYSAAVAVQAQNGAEYWNTYLVDYNGWGGIWVDQPITLEAAMSIVRKNLESANVFTLTLDKAQRLAVLTYDGVGRFTTPPEAHRIDQNGNYKPLNHQHIHAIDTKGARGKSHIFFAIPYMV